MLVAFVGSEFREAAEAEERAGDCADSRGFGTAINYRLKRWSVVPSTTA
jgi:hypothetical protein